MRFLLRKGVLNSVRDRLIPSDMLRTTTVDGLKFYHWIALPPVDLRYPDGREAYDMALNLEGNVALDVGSHIGSYALRLARRFRVVYAFEPSFQNFYVLDMNVRRNHLEKKVFPIKIAVSDSSGVANLNIPSSQPYAATLEGSHYDYIRFDHRMLTTKVSLDEYFFMYNRGVGKIDFVKIDVEGHEFFVLRGMEKIIEKHRPALLVEVHREPEIFSSLDDRCGCEICAWLRKSYSRMKIRYRPGEMAHWLECYS